MAQPLPISQGFGFSTSWGTQSKPPFSRPLTCSLLHAPPSVQKVGLWLLKISSRCVHEEIVTLGRTPDLPPRRGLPQLCYSPAAAGCSTAPSFSLLAGQPFLQLRFEMHSAVFTLIRDHSRSPVFGGSDVVLLVGCCKPSLSFWMAGICQLTAGCLTQR